MITRRNLLAVTAGTAAVAAVLPRLAFGQEITEKTVFHDPDAPVLGNPKGDVTVVEFFDYQCPYCKKIHPMLEKVVREDGNVRLVLKDWPILGDPSGYAARLVLAAKYQNKYEAAHRALIVKVGRFSQDIPSSDGSGARRRSAGRFSRARYSATLSGTSSIEATRSTVVSTAFT